MKAKYITPVVTVMDKEGNPDMEGCGKVYEHLIQGGVDGILLMGSIGEFFALTMSQKKELIRYAVHKINHRTQLIVGTTSMIVDEIIELSRFAKQEGADAVIILPPYYFPLGEKSLENYFGMLAEALSDQPIYLYNFPDRTGYDLTPEITLRLVRKYKNIVGYKDTQAGMDHTRELIKLVKGEFPEFEIYSGFDDNFARNIMAGGDGCIAGLSNLVPGLCHSWTEAFAREDLEQVSVLQKKIDRLMEIYQVGTPFIPYIKEAMAIKGIIDCACSSKPFPKASEEEKEHIRRILKKTEIL